MNWSELLKNEAISNYIVFALGILVGIAGWAITRYLSRRKPLVIDVVRIEETSVLEIDSNIKNDIKIEYKGSPVQSLYRTKYRVLNRGESPINNVQFELQIDTQASSHILYSVILDDSGKPLSGATASTPPVAPNSGKQEILINLDFLNPYSGYKEKVLLDIYSSSPFQTITARGRGLGWTVKYFDQIQYSENIDGTISVLLTGPPLAKFTGAVKLIETVVQVSLRK
jgi:hypothetical protein